MVVEQPVSPEAPPVETTPPPVEAPPQAANQSAAPTEATQQQTQPETQTTPTPPEPIDFAAEKRKLDALQQLQTAGYINPANPDHVQKLRNLSAEDLEFAFELMELVNDPNRVSPIEELVQPEAFEALKNKWQGNGGLIEQSLAKNRPELQADPAALQEAKVALEKKPLAEAMKELSTPEDAAADTTKLIEAACDTNDKLSGAAEAEAADQPNITPEERKKTRLQRLLKNMAEVGAVGASLLGDLTKLSVEGMMEMVASIDLGTVLDFLCTLQTDRRAVAFDRAREYREKGDQVITQTEFKDKLKTKDGFDKMFRAALQDVNQDTIPGTNIPGWGSKSDLTWTAFDKEGADKAAEFHKMLPVILDLVGKTEKRDQNWQKFESRLLFRMFPDLQNNPGELAKRHLDPVIVMNQSGGLLYDLVHADKDGKMFGELFGHLVKPKTETPSASPAAAKPADTIPISPDTVTNDAAAVAA